MTTVQDIFNANPTAEFATLAELVQDSILGKGVDYGATTLVTNIAHEYLMGKNSSTVAVKDLPRHARRMSISTMSAKDVAATLDAVAATFPTVTLSHNHRGYPIIVEFEKAQADLKAALATLDNLWLEKHQ